MLLYEKKETMRHFNVLFPFLNYQGHLRNGWWVLLFNSSCELILKNEQSRGLNRRDAEFAEFFIRFSPRSPRLPLAPSAIAKHPSGTAQRLLSVAEWGQVCSKTLKGSNLNYLRFFGQRSQP
jgi:hypothetical protein